MITEQQVVMTAALIVVVGLVALFLGMWWGVGKERERSAKELDEAWDELEREQAKARRTHPVYRQPSERTRVVLDYRPDPIPGLGTPIWSRTEEDQALAIANSHAIDTGEIQAITDRVDEWMATWIGDGHAVRDS